MNEELNNLIIDLISKKGGSQQDYRLLMDKIGFHESRLDPRAEQQGGGPGRGKYQFEVGRYRGGKTAANRAIRYYKNNNKPVPDWLKKLEKKDSVDASKLSSNQQDILFLTNMLGHPKADLGKVISGEQPVEDFWANYHWAGKKSDRPERIQSFNESSQAFDEQQAQAQPELPIEMSLEPTVARDVNPIERAVAPTGIFGNRFANGGFINPEEKLTNGRRSDTSPFPRYDNPTDPPTTPATVEQPRYPLKFTKVANRVLTEGYDRFLQDRRPQYTTQDYLSPTGDRVDFERAVTDESSRAFLNRYNNPITRQRLKEQTNLTDYDIDNAILQGLTAGKQVGGNPKGSKAAYDPKKHVVQLGHDHTDSPGVETHERIHASNLDAALGIPLLDQLGNPFEQKTRHFLKKYSPNTLRYLNRPHEAYGNFVEFREQLGLKPGEQIDEKRLKRLVKKKKLDTENFYRAFDDKNIVKALNTIAQTDNRQNNNTRYA